MNRGITIIIGGACLLIGGHFLSQMVLDAIPTSNPSHSSLIVDTNYHMISMSNKLSFASQVGIIVLVIGTIIFFSDKVKAKYSKNSNIN
jgi:hypothetical protein